MKVSIEEPKPWKRILDIEVHSSVVQEQLDTAFRRYRKDIRMPGFRQGKVPMDVLKARFGDEIRAEVVERLIPEYLKRAGADAEIRPIATPVIEDLHFHEGEALHFRAIVEIKPTIELKEYKGFQVTKRATVVTDEDIQRVLDTLRERHSNVVRVDGEAKSDQFVVADIQHLDSTGVPIIGKKEEKQFFRLGTGRLGTAFDEQMIGIKTGDERTISTVYPEDHPDENLAGQNASFTITAHEVLERILPEADDAFAVDVGAENLVTLRDTIRKDLEQEPEREVRSQVLKQLNEAYDFEVPDSMLTSYLDHVIEDAKRNTRQPVNEEEIRQSYQSVAVEQIKQTLIIDAIAQKEQITVSPEETDDRVRTMADRTHIAFDQLKRIFRDNGRLDRIEFDIREDKVVEFLIQQADIQVE